VAAGGWRGFDPKWGTEALKRARPAEHGGQSRAATRADAVAVCQIRSDQIRSLVVKMELTEEVCQIRSDQSRSDHVT